MAKTSSDGLIEKVPKFYCGSRRAQYFSAFVVNLTSMTVGTVTSWPATAIPDINTSKTSYFPQLLSDEAAWITAVGALGGVAVCPLAGYFMHKLGLRCSMLTLAIPLILGWFLILFADDFSTLFIGRFITGFSASGMSMATPVFVAETSDPEVRGMLGFAVDIMIAFGELYIFIVGSAVSWRWQTVACGVIPIIFLALIVFIPESPRVLIAQNKMDEAMKSLAWFRQAPTIDLIKEEFNSILEEEKATALEMSQFEFRHYFSAPILKPTLICVILMFFYNASGSSAILAYTVQIFQNAHVANAFLATILTGLTQVVVASISALFVDHVGRRVLLMLSALGMAVCLFPFAAYLHWEHEFGRNWTWLPIALVMMYIVMFSIGFGPIPCLIVGELVPPGAKGYTTAIATASYRLFAFLSLVIFNDTVNSFGQDICFALFGVAAVVACAYVYIFVPETKQKSLAEIQLHFGIRAGYSSL